MKLNLLFIVLFAFAFDVNAKDPEPVSMGDGTYLITDKNVTIFGSPEKIVVKLMKIAHSFCQTKTGQEARLLDTTLTDAVPGYSGQLGSRPGKGASAAIQFACNGSAQNAPQNSINSSSASQDAYAQKVEAIQKRVLDGDLQVIKAEIAQDQGGFKLLPVDVARALEKSNTWWHEGEGKIYIYISNASAMPIHAMSFLFSAGYCSGQSSLNTKETFVSFKNRLEPSQAAVILVANPMVMQGEGCLTIVNSWGKE